MTETPKDGMLPPNPSAAPSEQELARRQGEAFARTLRELTPRVVVTPVLVAVNLAVFGLMVASGVSPTEPSVPDALKWGADHGPSVFAGEWWRTLTCAFVHLGLLHLALNMFVLATAGPLVERLVGNVGFLVLYLAAALGGSVASLGYHPLAVSAGASGAVFGVYGALIAVLRQKAGAVPAEVLARIRNSGLAFVGYNLVFGFLASGIDNAAHVGGLAVGFLCGAVLNLPLAPASRAKRPARNALAALLGAAVAVAGALAVSALHADLAGAVAELERFEVLEKRALATANAAWAKTERGEMSAGEAADVLERDVLPDWRASAQRFAAIKNVPPTIQSGIAAMLGYMRLRQDGWELAARGLRTGDAELMRQAHAKQAQAEEAARKFNPTGK